MLPAGELLWLELWADWMWLLESEPACGCAGVEPLDPPFLYQQGQECPLWTIFPDLEFLHVSKLPIQNSMINKIKCDYAEVNHISSNIWYFSLHLPVFFPLVLYIGKSHLCSSQMLSPGSQECQFYKMHFDPMRCHFSLYPEWGVDGMCGKHFNLVNSLIWSAT